MRMMLLAAAALAAAPVSSTTPAERIDVILSNFEFTPEVITFRHGEPYHLHLRNASSGGHSFKAEAFFADASMAPEERARIAGGKIELGGGETFDLMLTAPAAPATYEVKCTHFLHAAFGMTGKIVVE
jgi:uncharacterized cupredoxin-like copper-binding protein